MKLKSILDLFLDHPNTYHEGPVLRQLKPLIDQLSS